MKPYTRPLAIHLGLVAAVLSSATAEEVKRFEPTGSLPYLSVEEGLKTFHLPEGYRLELILTEPVATAGSTSWRCAAICRTPTPPARTLRTAASPSMRTPTQTE